MRAGPVWLLAATAAGIFWPLVIARRVVDSGLQDTAFPRLLSSFGKKTSPSKPVIAESRDEHLVTELPGLEDGAFPTKQYAGHIPVVDGFHFYWLFESAGPDPSSAPLVIWLNGGPGCSSMDGLWLENGPFRLSNLGQKITVNPYSWHNVANLLYVDQPVGTGLSFTTKGNYADNDLQVDEQFYLFLSNFLDLHSQFKTEGNRSRPIFFTGESHAGHYIPSMVAHILTLNQAAVAAGKGELVIDVQGMMIGNGWIDPVFQYDVSDYAFGMGLIDAGQRRALKLKEKECLASLKGGQYNDNKCMALMDAVVAASSGKTRGIPSVSMYDVRNYELGRKFPPGHGVVEAYLNRKDVREAIHARSCPIRFKECTDPPYMHLAKWDGLGVTSELRSVLNAGVRSLFFNGQYDLICNHIGNQRALENLGGWEGAEEWESSTRGVWLSDGKGDDEGGFRHPIGYAKEKSGNPLTFLLVLMSGHMVPLDQPRSALDMLKRFLRGEAFSDSEQIQLGVGSCSGEGALDCSSEVPGCASPPLPSGPPPHLSGGVHGGELLRSSPPPPPPPPRIIGIPVVGQDSAAVGFTHASEGLGRGARGGGGDGAGAGAADGDEGGAAATVVSYEARSSPDGIVGIGPASPVVVRGLIPGRTYTFSVTAVYSATAAAPVAAGGPADGQVAAAAQGGGGADGGGEELMAMLLLRSSPSEGSPAVTPGCGQSVGGGGDQKACSGHGVCREGGQEGVCVCENGYSGDKCEVPVAGEGDVRGGGGSVEGRASAEGGARDVEILLEENFSVLQSSAKENGRTSDVGLQFLLRPGAFRDPEFVLAIRTPRLLPPRDQDTESGDTSPASALPSISAGSMEAWDERGSAFSALLRADVGQALGVPTKAVSVGGISPAGETRVDWETWRQWGAGALNVSVLVKSDTPEDTGRRLVSAWNDPSSRLHAGVITGLIDFSQGAQVSYIFPSGRDNSKAFNGPTLFATFLYIACFALAIPACGMSRRFCSSRRKRSSGGAGSSTSGSGNPADGGGGASRRGWRVPFRKAGVGLGDRLGEGGGVHEMVSLAGEEEEDGNRREGARV